MAKKIEGYLKLNIPAGAQIHRHQLVQHLVSAVLTSWNSVKHLMRQQIALKRTCLFLLLLQFIKTNHSHSQRRQLR